MVDQDGVATAAVFDEDLAKFGQVRLCRGVVTIAVLAPEIVVGREALADLRRPRGEDAADLVDCGRVVAKPEAPNNLDGQVWATKVPNEAGDIHSAVEEESGYGVAVVGLVTCVLFVFLGKEPRNVIFALGCPQDSDTKLIFHLYPVMSRNLKPIVSRS
eukprot:jgi/Psemu1/308022/fgenesh1_kg.373_\